MKKSINGLIITLALVCTGLSPAAQNQPASLPYSQDFETTFSPGNAFLDHWTGNRMNEDVMGQYLDEVTGNRALFMTPEGEELPTIATLSLDLSTSPNEFAYLHFFVAVRQNETDEDMKRTKLTVTISVNGGPFGYGMKVGPERGFDNMDKPFELVTYPFPPHAYGQSNVKVRFTGKAGGGRCLPAKLLIDDVYVDANPTDIHAPFIVGSVRPLNLNTIEIKFGEPVLESVATDKNNYTFFWPDDHHGEVTVGTKLPKVSKVTLTNNDHNVLLTLNPAMQRGDYYSMSINTMEDLSGNAGDYDDVEELVYNVPAPGDLQITEIFYADPSTAHPKQKLQFVEIYNPTSKIVPIGGLRIKGAISAHNMPNVKLHPGDFYVITRNAEAFSNTFGFPAWEWKGSWIEYPTQQHEDHDDGIIESQMLYIQTTEHHSAEWVDVVAFNLNNAPWSDLCVNGYSMEWCNLNSDNADPYNWALADDSGAPYTYTHNGASYDIYATPGRGRTGALVCGPNDEKVIVCHQTGNGLIDLCIDPEDVGDHLAHGDQFGSCAGACEEEEVQFRSEEEESGEITDEDRLLTVMPNPFNQYTWISAHPSLGMIRQISILDLQGKLIRTYEGIDQASFILTADNLPPGIYLLHIRTDHHNRTVRIIMQ